MGRAVLRKYDVVLDIVQRLITIRNNQWDYQIVEGFEERPEEIRSWKKSSEANNEIRKRFFVGMPCQQFRYLESVLLIDTPIEGDDYLENYLDHYLK